MLSHLYLTLISDHVILKALWKHRVFSFFAKITAPLVKGVTFMMLKLFHVVWGYNYRIESYVQAANAEDAKMRILRSIKNLSPNAEINIIECKEVM